MTRREVKRLAREAAITGAAWGLALVALPWLCAIVYLLGRAETPIDR